MFRMLCLVAVLFAGPIYSATKTTPFIQCGRALWYHTKYQNHRTASGERYNLQGMTAAHRTLPIPSNVRVTNLRNGRVVIVKINDRGPFHTKSIIDLSTAAAKKLGISNRETAYVQLEVMTSKSSPHASIQYTGQCRRIKK